MQYCLEPGCPNKVDRGRCPTHARTLKQEYGRFKTGRTAYTTVRWIQLRDRFREDHPFCVHTKQNRGCTLTTDVVDHIVRHEGDEELMFDEANLQPLCYHCHGVKTAQETWGRGQVKA